MATARSHHHHHRASSTAAAPLYTSTAPPPPPIYSKARSSTSSLPPIESLRSLETAPETDTTDDDDAGGSGARAAIAGPPTRASAPRFHHSEHVPSSVLQPRVAVVLNVPDRWHPWLFALRLCSILPASWWGLPSLLRLLLRLLPGPKLPLDLEHHAAIAASAPYALTETALATIWVRQIRRIQTSFCGRKR